MKKSIHILLVILAFAAVSKAQDGLPDSCLIAKYYFNNGSTNDQVGTSHGTAIGTSLVPDRFNNPNSAHYLFGVPNSYIKLGTYAALKPQNLSVSMWFKAASTVTTGAGYTYNPLLLTKCMQGNNYFESYCIYYNFSNSKIVMGTTDTLTYFQPAVNSTGTVSLNNWHHVVITLNQSAVGLYVDGVSQGSSVKGFPTYYLTPDSIMIGNSANPQNDRYFNGAVDDIRFYKCVIGQDLVTTLYNETYTPTVTAVQEQHTENMFRIFPNPANTNLKINSEKLIRNVSVTDMLGKVVIAEQEINLKNTELNVEHLSKGIYFVKVSGDDWQIATKLVKE